jgi:hypothetical protein
MHEMKSSSLLVFLGMLSVGFSHARAQQSCSPDIRRSSVPKAFSDSLSRRFGGGTVDSSGVHLETARVTFRRECLLAAAFSWNDEFEGGVIIFKVQGPMLTVRAMSHYPGARSVMSAGDNRVVFSYSAGRGSGYRAERTAVLCALAEDNWVPCMDLLTGYQIAASGYPTSDSLAKGMRLGMRSAIQVARDTLILHSTVQMRRYAQSAETKRVLISRIPLP